MFHLLILFFVVCFYLLCSTNAKVAGQMEPGLKPTSYFHSQDQLVLKLDNLPAGEYLCFITVNGKSIGNKKITLIK